MKIFAPAPLKHTLLRLIGTNMKILIACITLLLLIACTEAVQPLTPFQCRVTGVAVEDGDTVTGFVSKEMHLRTTQEVRATCMAPFAVDIFGCAIAINTHEYIVVHKSSWNNRAIRYLTDKNHEYCHAFYEEGRHMY